MGEGKFWGLALGQWTFGWLTDKFGFVGRGVNLGVWNWVSLLGWVVW